MIHQSKVAFIDTETTGLDPEYDYVWEVAVIVDDVEHVWQQRLPDSPCVAGEPNLDLVSDWVLENTRIKRDYSHDDALTPADSLDQLVNLVHGRHLIGACPWFDSERLHRVNLAHYGRESGQRDLPWHYHLIDVENLAIGYIAGLRRAGVRHRAKGVNMKFDETNLPWGSTDLSLALGVDPADFEPKHSALADARWAKAMYEAMMGAPS